MHPEVSAILQQRAAAELSATAGNMHCGYIGSASSLCGENQEHQKHCVAQHAAFHAAKTPQNGVGVSNLAVGTGERATKRCAAWLRDATRRKPLEQQHACLSTIVLITYKEPDTVSCINEGFPCGPTIVITVVRRVQYCTSHV